MSSILTERQRQCLRGFIERKTAKQIGRELGITHYAVEQHLKAARRKLGTRDTLEAARRCFGADATVTPYYDEAELSYRMPELTSSWQPESDIPVLRDIAAEEMGRFQTLSPGQTLFAICLCGFGMVGILALIVAVANGVAELTH